jgi:hypothetical protein
MVSRKAIWSKKRYAEDPDYRRKTAANSLRHYTAHKDKINERRRERYRTDPEYREQVLEWSRRYQAGCYGTSPDYYDVLLARQGGVCAICKRKYKRRLDLDHCHSTNKLRLLLCNKCNTSLGLHNDDPDSMLAAVAYLEVWRQEIGSADAGVIAARIVKRLRRRLEVLVRAALALRRQE